MQFELLFGDTKINKSIESIVTLMQGVATID